MIENTPRTETSRLVLRKFTEEDAQSLLLIMKDEEVNTFLPWFPLETLEQAQELLQNVFLSCYQLPRAYHYAICLKKDNLPIGYVNISDNDSHDLGYGLRKEFWHNGIVTEACKAVIKQCKNANLPYITATHDINNPRSGAVMQKIGMTYQYSYEELVMPKNMLVTFRMYQLNLNGESDFVYKEYWNKHPKHFVEENA